MRIVLSTNCQTGGLAAGIRAIFPNAEVIPIPLPPYENLDKTGELINSLHKADIWISGNRFELAENIPIKVIIKVPEIIFDAFHPDIIYSRSASTNEQTTIPYNSRIAVWAYNHQILPVDAARLFNYQTYKSLGYLASWNKSVDSLYKRFELFGYSSMEFNTFFNRLKRRGLFMHLENHPHVFALVELAKLVGRRLGASSDLLSRDIIVPDGLTDKIWPVYTEIADDLAIEGNYIWRINNQEIEGAINYLEFVYSNYKEHEILPMDLTFDNNGIESIDSILGSQL